MSPLAREPHPAWSSVLYALRCFHLVPCNLPPVESIWSLRITFSIRVFVTLTALCFLSSSSFVIFSVYVDQDWECLCVVVVCRYYTTHSSSVAHSRIVYNPQLDPQRTSWPFFSGWCHTHSRLQRSHGWFQVMDEATLNQTVHVFPLALEAPYGRLVATEYIMDSHCSRRSQQLPAEWNWLFYHCSVRFLQGAFLWSHWYLNGFPFRSSGDSVG